MLNKLLACSVVVLSLTACASKETVNVKVICPSLVEYPVQVQRELAEELEQNKDAKQTQRFIADYAALRDQVRACKNGETK